MQGHLRTNKKKRNGRGGGCIAWNISVQIFRHVLGRCYYPLTFYKWKPKIGPRGEFLEIYTDWTGIPTVAKGKCDTRSHCQSQ